MRLTMMEKRTLVRVAARDYRKASKGGKGVILDRLVRETGYNRNYAARLLRGHGKRVRLRRGVIAQGDLRVRRRRKRPKKYGRDVQKALRGLWIMLDYLSGKRLAPALKIAVPALVAHGELDIPEDVRAKLLAISPASIDRILAKEKRKYALRNRSRTKPGTLLKHQIPIRTFSDWDDGAPGFLEVDLVAHDGGNSRGDFCQTLDAVDVATTWTEQAAVKNKARVWVFEAIKDLRGRFPFEVLGIDSDNGAEFINHHLKKYCEDEELTFTRSRPYRKNDSCHVEQKNWSIVRRAVGYSRFESDEALALLNDLYGVLRLTTNFFIPTMRLKEKIRDGARVKRRYGKPMTPYERVMASEKISADIKRDLAEIFKSLNPATLHRRIVRIQSKLQDAAAKPGTARAVEDAGPDGKAAGFPTGSWKTPGAFSTAPTAPTAIELEKR